MVCQMEGSLSSKGAILGSEVCYLLCRLSSEEWHEIIHVPEAFIFMALFFPEFFLWGFYREYSQSTWEEA